MARSFRGALALLALLSASFGCEECDGLEEDLTSLLQKSLHVMGGTERLAPTGKEAGRKPPVVVVDLDEVPERRWRNVTKYYTDLGVYPDLLLKREPLTPALRALAKTMEFGEDYLREKKGILADMGLPDEYLDHLILSDLNDELSGMQDGPTGMVGATSRMAVTTMAGCSAVLAAMPDGTVVHGRNMDYGSFSLRVGDKLFLYPDITIEVIFMRKGRPLITSVHWPLMTGVHTAMKFGEWSFEHNTRFHYLDSSVLSGLFQKTEGYKLAVRRLMESDLTFEEVVQSLYNQRWMGPHYFVLAGSKPWQGAVVTTDRDGLHVPETPKIRRISNPAVPGEGEGWRLVQANDDGPGKTQDPRRAIEEAKLYLRQQDEASPEFVMTEMESKPLRHSGTVFSTVFVPRTGYYQTHLHFDSYQSPEWDLVPAS